jgi:hypothetical protein
MLRLGQQRHTPIATSSDEVQIPCAVVTTKLVGHKRGLARGLEVRMLTNEHGRARSVVPSFCKRSKAGAASFVMAPAELGQPLFEHA